jgi:hypothetical protein
VVNDWPVVTLLTVKLWLPTQAPPPFRTEAVIAATALGLGVRQYAR